VEMNASQFLIVVSLLILPTSVYADFDPDSLTDLIVVSDAPCQPFYCVVVQKGDTEYLIVLNQGNEIAFVFLKVGDELSLLWAKELV